MTDSLRAILFDFDGTLADTAPDMVAALNDWLAARSRPPADSSVARDLCSGGARALLGLHGWKGETFEAARDDYLRRYENTDYRRSALFVGISDVLASISAAGLRWGIVTNKPRRYFAPLARRLGLAESAAIMICGDDYPLAKPHPMPLIEAAERLSTPLWQCAYVGDDPRDGIAAIAAAMPFIAATWGYWRFAQWRCPDAPLPTTLVSTPGALLPACLSILCVALQQKRQN